MLSLTIIDDRDLIFSGDIEDDRTNTFVHLLDYDWMNYSIETSFHTNELGILNVRFEYAGMTLCTMSVHQEKDFETRDYLYAYDSKIFVEYIKKFLTQHMKQWDSQYAFNGEEIVVNFYNKVLKEGYLTDGKDLTKKVEE